MYPDYDNDEFNPLSEEDLRRMEEDDEFRRRVRREVLRMQSGDADEDIERDRAQIEEQEQEEQAEQERKRKKRSRLFYQLFSGNILVNKSVANNYGYFVAIAVMCFISIAVMFMVLYADLRFSSLERDLQLVRERSIRLQEQLYSRTTHAAVKQELERRGIPLQDPNKATEVVE